jgi:hypothetical protein
MLGRRDESPAEIRTTIPQISSMVLRFEELVVALPVKKLEASPF